MNINIDESLSLSNIDSKATLVSVFDKIGNST